MKAELQGDWQARLIAHARDAREHAHAPYSHYKVGAAVLAGSGRIYGGCNIEYATYTLTRHAEMTAFEKAISEGERDFLALAVITDDKSAPFPCALCRQVMAEHCAPAFVVIGANMEGAIRKTTLAGLYPHCFGPRNLEA
ncbi:MAG: cytidine deaminase [Candidatus Eremiobacteraeota bacterium]|nr:cytidine deaminase [Candidatus Eremiobacteraeota bacterium]